VGHNVQVRSGSTIAKGSVISFNVIIGHGANIPPFSKIILEKIPQSRVCDLGEGGIGRLWTGTPLLPSSQTALTPEQSHQVLSNASKELVVTDIELNLKDLDDDEGSSSEEIEEELWVSSRERFLKEVSETVYRTETECPVDWLENVNLEIKALKLTENTSLLETSEAILLAIIELASSSGFTQLRALALKWKPQIDRFLDGPERSEDEVELIFKLQEFCEKKSQYSPHFSLILQTFYTVNIIKSKSIISWADELEGAEGEDKTFYDQCESLLRGLREKVTPTPAPIKVVPSQPVIQNNSDSEDNTNTNLTSVPGILEWEDDSYSGSED